ncbi:MAG TPA: hypothetical protein VGX00_05895 [Thermoplasmata archaeon]|nr:hypothetical protein [Thermoplasmata archaeon]
MLMEVAAEMDTGYTVGELSALLPSEVDERQIEEWLRAHPALARFDGPVVRPAESLSPRSPERVERGRRYREAAIEFMAGPLRTISPWVRCVALTGSTAYGEPESGDDIDFLVVVRSGSVWVTLAFLYLAARFGSRPMIGGQHPEFCFNYVVDERQALEEFARPQGFLFAREALSVRVLQGSEFYEGLLAHAAWMKSWVPRLYGSRASHRAPPLGRPAGWSVRLLNLAIYPLLSTYLQLIGLVRNRRFRTAGTAERSFAVRSQLGRLAFFSSRFDRLRRRYEADPGVAFPPGGPGPTPGGSRSNSPSRDGFSPVPTSETRARPLGSGSPFRDGGSQPLPEAARGTPPPA